MFVDKVFSHMIGQLGLANATRSHIVEIFDRIAINESEEASIELWVCHHVSQDVFTLVVQITTLETTDSTLVFSFIGAASCRAHVRMDFISQLVAVL